MDGALELRAEPRRAPPVDDDHGEPLLGEPLAGEVGASGGDDALGVRPAVGVHQHRQRASPGSCQDGSSSAVGRRRAPARSRVTRGTRPGGSACDGDRRDGPRRARTVVTVPSTVEVLARDDERAAAQPARRARRPRVCGRPARRDPTSTARSTPGLSLARNRTVSPSTSSTPRTCSDGGVTGIAVDDQPARRRRRRRPSPARPRPCARAPRARCPPRPGRCARGSRVVAPVAGSTRSMRSAVWSRGCTTTSSPWSSQTTSARYSLAAHRPGSAAPSKRDDLGADLRVRRAGGRVGDDGGLAVGVRGVGDVPALHRVCRRPGRRPARPRGRPPVAAHPLHLLGRDEVGEPVADLRRRPASARVRVVPAVEVVHVQRAAADVGDVAARAGRGADR